MEYHVLVAIGKSLEELPHETFHRCFRYGDFEFCVLVEQMLKIHSHVFEN